MNKISLFFFVFSFLGSSSPTYAEESSVRDCDSIIWSAVQRKDILKLDTSYKGIFTSWQCQNTFSSHNEAINSGLEVETVVYGVPLKVNGTYDKTKVDIWKQQNCSSQSKVVDTKTLLELTKNDLTPADVQLYGICVKGVERLATREGLNCWSEANSQTGVTVFVRWRPYSDSPAIIKSAAVTGAVPVKNRAEDESFLPSGEHIRIGTTILGFERTPSAASMKFILNTTQDSCDIESATSAYYKINGWMQPKVTVTESKTFTQQQRWTSDNCALIENRTSEHCVDEGWTRVGQSWTTTGDRCGSAVNSAVAKDARCATYSSLFRGCGYKSVLTIKNCEGSPYLQYNMNVVGQKSQISVKNEYKKSFTKEGAYANQVSIGYEGEIPKETPIVGWNYNVEVLVSRGPDKKLVSLSNASPDNSGLKSIVKEGSLVITLEQ